MKQKQHRYRNRHLAVRGLQKINKVQQRCKAQSQPADNNRCEQ